MFRRLKALVAALALGACAAEAEATAERHVRAFYPEGALYQGDTLYYAEMGADRISRLVNGQRTTFFQESGCGPTALAPYGSGFAVLCHIGEYVVEVNAQGQRVRAWDRADDGRTLQDPNDVSADGHGGIYFSDPGLFSRRSMPQGSLMHLDAQGRITRIVDYMWYPNGVYADLPRRRLYVTEHMAGKVWVFDLDDQGRASNKRLFVDAMSLLPASRYSDAYAETGPDGLEIGPDGDLFQAMYGAGRILRISPQGRLVGTIDTPGRYVTNISFDTHGNAATTASFDNINPPYEGEVRIYLASSLTRRTE